MRTLKLSDSDVFRFVLDEVKDFAIVEAHRGRVWAENNSAGGAVFTFVIPPR
ncbi:MAG: hypothetical protein JJE51_00055 [Thermoanaerobaculia bacterium]|nr:hypothetical protein [Thermoanaerobaculia bacterium]